MKTKSITVQVDASTWRWLRALAKANSHTQLNQRVVQPAHLLAQAARCMADHAGRSSRWTATVAGNMLIASNYEGVPGAALQDKLRRRDEREKR